MGPVFWGVVTAMCLIQMVIALVAIEEAYGEVEFNRNRLDASDKYSPTKGYHDVLRANLKDAKFDLRVTLLILVLSPLGFILLPLAALWFVLRLGWQVLSAAFGKD